MRRTYAERLIETLGMPANAAREFRSGCVAWFQIEATSVEQEALAHFVSLVQGGNPVVHPYAYVCLTLLKNVTSNALVESRCSDVTLVKSKHRVALGEKKLLGYLMMGDEPNFCNASMPALWHDLKAEQRQSRKPRVDERSDRTKERSTKSEGTDVAGIVYL